PYPIHSFTTNNAGFRAARSLEETSMSGEIRVFVTGGSAAWGAGVRQEDLYTRIAEKELRKEFPDRPNIRVVCAGVGAYCSVQERILTETVITRYNPDIVISFSGWNDSYFGYTGLDIRDGQDYMGYGRKLAWLSGGQVDDLEKVIDPPQYRDYRVKLHFLLAKSLHRVRFSKSDLAQGVELRKLEHKQVLETLLDNIHSLTDLSRRKGFSMVFMLQPSLYLTCKPLSEWEKLQVAENSAAFTGFPEYNREVYRLFRETFPQDSYEKGYTFADLDLAFSGVEQPLFADHVHFGDRGNRLIGEYMAQIISPLISRRLSR
ncbi:MAG: hypothetical protein PHQ23_02640, partial [Candidatus Wallbacteria bacterium]|nr:hypothetical protein [Candidatus Wallbacteria bacterium]